MMLPTPATAKATGHFLFEAAQEGLRRRSCLWMHPQRPSDLLLLPVQRFYSGLFCFHLLWLCFQSLLKAFPCALLCGEPFARSYKS